MNIELPVELKKELTIDYSNGTVYATARGTARLAGISPAQLVDQREQTNGLPKGLLGKLKVLGDEVITSEGLKSPQTLSCKRYGVIAWDFHQLFAPYYGFNFWENETIPDKLVETIVYYFGFDSKKPNDTARNNYRLFASVGFRALSWSLFNYSPFSSQDPFETSKVISNLSNQLTELTAMVREQNERLDIVTSSWKEYPGIETISQQHYRMKGKALPKPQGRRKNEYSIKEILEMKGVHLNGKQLQRVGIKVSHAYYTLKSGMQTPHKTTCNQYPLSESNLILTLVKMMSDDIGLTEQEKAALVA